MLDITDAQWELVAPLLYQSGRSKEGPGRPRRDPRDVLNGIFWILRTGAQWADLPHRYPPYQTCHRYFQQWFRDGTLEQVLHALAEDLYDRGRIDITEAFTDGSLLESEREIPRSESTSGATAPNSWQLQTALVFRSPPGLRVLRSMLSDSRSRRSTAPSSSTRQPS